MSQYLDKENNVLFNILYEIALAHGDGFFDTVVESISKNLGIKYVLIGEFSREVYRVRAKSLWAGEALVKEYEYAVKDTPCEHVINSEGIKIFQDNVQSRFPEDLDLVEWELESYMGVPLFNEQKQIIGHLAILDTKPIKNIHLLETVLKTCASRLEAELSRAITDELIKKREQENKLKTQQLAHSVSLLQATIESSTDGLLIVNTRGEMLQFNQKFLDMWQIPTKLLNTGGSIIDFLLPQLQTPKEFVHRLKEVYLHQNLQSFDIIHFKDGRAFERHSQPQIVGTEIVGRVWSFRDITQRIRAEEELRKSEFLFRSLFEESPIGIVIDVHPKNKLVHVNKKFSRMLGYSLEELTEMTAKDITHPEDLYNYLSPFNTIESNKVIDSNFEKRYLTKNGEIIWGGVSLSVVRNNDGGIKHRVLMIQDITEKKRALTNLKEKAEELNEKNKQLQKYIDSNMQLENFAYIASHDLREPLLTTIGLVEILIDSYGNELNEEALSFLNFIDQCVKNMEVLINDLLTYSRVNTQVHIVKNFNMEKLLQTVLQGLQKTIEEQNASIKLSNIPQELIGNETKMVQLFQNLIANAIKFKKPNVHPIIKISAAELEKSWQFSISDNGIGIDSKSYDKIFLLFKKLHSKYQYEGTGIGLATCKKIVEQHEGKIWVESTINQGTTFHFTIAKSNVPQSK
ncbi:MAG: PAS domain S-box protein [Chitinophagales bacterium]